MGNLFKIGEFLGTVQYSAEDEVFYGKILGVDDLVTFEGCSIRELKKAFKFLFGCFFYLKLNYK